MYTFSNYVDLTGFDILNKYNTQYMFVARESYIYSGRVGGSSSRSGNVSSLLNRIADQVDDMHLWSMPMRTCTTD